jgi:hypothetical protein
MIVFIHVLIALTSIAYSGFTFLRPSNTRLRNSYFLVALTLASGTFLVVNAHAQMVPACISGLVYLAIVSAGLAGARYKLAKEPAQN